MQQRPSEMHSNEEPETPIDSFLTRIAAARVVILFLFHAVVFAACYALANLLRFDFTIPQDYMAIFKTMLPVVVGVQLTVGGFFGFYRGWWRYVGMGDVIRLGLGLSTATAVLTAIHYITRISGTVGYNGFSRGVLSIDWAFTLLSLFGARLLIRLGRDHWRPNEESSADAKRVLIIGAGDAGETLAREIEHRPQLGMKVAGFVDDQRAKWNSYIRGIKVHGPISTIAKLADDLGADEALIAIPSASGRRIREIIHHLSAADLRFKTIPGIDHLVSGKVHVTQLRPVNVEDLIRRKRIDLPGDPVRTMFRGKRVLVTGAGGSIGSELATQILQMEPEELTLVERSEYALYEVRKRLMRDASWSRSTIHSRLADIRDTELMKSIFAQHKPQIVLHAAAHKHVPLGEENPIEYLRNNTIATRSLAEVAVDFKVECFVLISTDKAINPTSVMGATKRAAEILLLDLARQSSMKTTIVRFGNVAASSGSVIPLFMEQIAAGGPVTVTHPDVTRYFLRTSEAVSLVLQAATLGDCNEVFMLDMGEPIRIVDLARDLIQLSNHTEAEIPIVFTGLRPGEKLFEEIRLDGESVKPTVHPQIVVTEAQQPESRICTEWTQRVRFDREAPRSFVIRELKRLIPEYQVADEPAAAATTSPAIDIAVPILRSNDARA